MTPEALRTLPDQILVRFRDTFLAGSAGILSGFAGIRRDVAGILSTPPTSGTHSAGFPLGYGDLAQRFKFAVPHRGAGVLNPVPGGYNEVLITIIIIIINYN